MEGVVIETMLWPWRAYREREKKFRERKQTSLLLRIKKHVEGNFFS